MANVNKSNRVNIGEKLKTCTTFDTLRECIAGISDDELTDLANTLERASDYVDITVRDQTILNQCRYEMGVRGEFVAKEG